MEKTLFILLAAFTLLVMPQCSTQEVKPNTISINEFSSDDVSIKLPYDELIECYGAASHSMENKINIYDSLGVNVIASYPFIEYHFFDPALSYVVVGDSAELRSIDFIHGDRQLSFRGVQLNRNTTIEQLNRLLRTSLSDYNVIYDQWELLNTCNKGYSLMYFGEEDPLLGNIEFVFDSRQRLIKINFNCPPGSIVYQQGRGEVKGER